MRAGGFTILELLIVISLLVVFAATFLPNVGGAFGFRIREASREVAAELEYVAQRSIATGVTHRWEVDFEAQRFRVQRLERSDPAAPFELPTHAGLLELTPPGETTEYASVDNRTGEWRELETTGVEIDEIRIGDQSVMEGTAGITFAADGGADPAEVWLFDENQLELRIRIIAFTGEVRVDEDATRER